MHTPDLFHWADRPAYAQLMWQTGQIKSLLNFLCVVHVLKQAAINADHTIRDEHLPPEDWEAHFIGTLGTILSDGTHNHHVVNFFTRRGIKY